MEDPKLQQLAAELDEAIKRVDNMQKKSQSMSVSSRVSKHMDKHGAILVNVLLAGAACILAFQKLQLKRELEDKKTAWEMERKFLIAEKRRLEEQAEDLHRGLSNIISGVPDRTSTAFYSLPSPQLGSKWLGRIFSWPPWR